MRIAFAYDFWNRGCMVLNVCVGNFGSNSDFRIVCGYAQKVQLLKNQFAIKYK